MEYPVGRRTIFKSLTRKQLSMVISAYATVLPVSMGMILTSVIRTHRHKANRMPERYAGALERVVSELRRLAKLNCVDFGHERIDGHYSPTLPATDQPILSPVLMRGYDVVEAAHRSGSVKEYESSLPSALAYFRCIGIDTSPESFSNPGVPTF